MRLVKKILLLFVGVLTTGAVNLSAQGLILLHAFGPTATSDTNADGLEPRSGLILSGNTLYGTTPLGGTNGFGTVFSVNTNGSNFTLLHTFTGLSDGAIPNKDLVLSGNMLYGTVGSGTNRVGYGSLFALETNGSNFSLLYTFNDNMAGAFGQPNGGLVLNGDTLYGTAYQGGISNAGSIFSVNTNGMLIWAYLFNSGTDGKNPLGTLILSGDTLYGTARNGGSNGLFGTVFSINTNGNDFTVLYTFAGHLALDGGNPDAGLALSGSTLYGTTAFGGTNNHGTVFAINTNGSNYAILHSFAGAGEVPEAGLVSRGNTVYGTTLGDGTDTSGTIYSVNTDGNSFTLLHTFSAANSDEGYTNSDGAQPYGSLTLAGNILYGTTTLGGPTGNGTLFSQAVIPAISSFSFAGTNLLFNGINALAGGVYTLRTSTNLTLPLNEWTPIATNVLADGGNFVITATNGVTADTARYFFILQVQ